MKWIYPSVFCFILSIFLCSCNRKQEDVCQVKTTIRFVNQSLLVPFTVPAANMASYRLSPDYMESVVVENIEVDGKKAEEGMAPFVEPNYDKITVQGSFLYVVGGKVSPFTETNESVCVFTCRIQNDAPHSDDLRSFKIPFACSNITIKYHIRYDDGGKSHQIKLVMEK